MNISWSGDRVAFLLLLTGVVQTLRAANSALRPADGKEKERLQDWLGAFAAWACLGAWAWFQSYDFTERLLNSLAAAFTLWFAAALALKLKRRLEKSDWFYDWGWSGFSAVWLALIIRATLMEVYSIPSESMVPTLLINDHVVVSKTTFGWHIPFTHGRFMQFRPVKRGEIVIFIPPNAPTQSYVKRCVGIPGDTVEVRDKVLYIDGKPAEVPYSFGRILGHIPPKAITALQAQADRFQAANPSPKDPNRTTWLGPIDVDGAGRYYLEASAVNVRVYARILDKPTAGEFETFPKELRMPAGSLDWARDHGLGNRDWFGPYKLAPDEYWMMGDDRDNSLDSRFFGPVKAEELRGTPLVRYWPPSRWGTFK